jgi:hypothetical protein
VEAGSWPAAKFGGGRRRWPRRLGERAAGRRNATNKQALELHQNLRKLLEQLACDEHGREELAPSGGGNGGGRLGWRAEGRGNAFIGGSRRPWMMAGDGGDATPYYGARAARVRR